MTKYMQRSFSVGGASKAYDEAYDRIFRGKAATEADPAKRARTWQEQVTFAECVGCGESIELGIDVGIAGGETVECDSCGLHMECAAP